MASGTCRTPFCSAAPLSLCARRASQADIPSGRAWTSQALLTRRRGQAVSGVAQAGAPFRPRRRACAMPCRATRGAARLPSLVAAESRRSRPELRLSRAQRAMSSREVELGFAEEAVARWRLSREQFPSKVGGRPAWLGESGLPGPVELRCGVCGQPCAFLLQLYAPLPDRPDAFHRSLFLFSCRQPACYRPIGQAPGSLRVFRNQLPRKNDIYSYEPPPEEPPPEEEPCAILQLKCGMKLCKVCGCLGPKACSKCHKAYYCSKDHQVRDWKAGHKLSCTQSEKMDIEIPDHTFLFPEYEILIEPEEMKSSNVDETEQEDLDTNKDSASADNTYEAAESLDENMLETMAKHETEDDKIFQKFKERTSLAPEQIIRYCRDGEGPIWISGENIPSETEIPNCVCGAKRVFEFQVMPQLLNYLKVDSLGESIDWGTVAIYTCADNCNLGNQYTEEFIWKQDISSSV